MNISQIKSVLKFNVFWWNCSIYGVQRYSICQYISTPPNDANGVAKKIRELEEVADFSFHPNENSKDEILSKINILTKKIKALYEANKNTVLT